MRLFGFNFGDDSQFRFVQDAAERGADCDNFPFSVAVTVIASFISLLSDIIIHYLKETATGFSPSLFLSFSLSLFLFL